MKISPVTPFLFRGPRPETYEDVNQLVRSGITTTVNLQSQEDNNKVTMGFIFYEIRNYDLENIAIFPPKASSVNLAIQIFLGAEISFAAAVINNEKVFIHCRQGVDRTGFVIAKYRMSQGWTKEEAVKEMKAMGLHFWFYWWVWFL